MGVKINKVRDKKTLKEITVNDCAKGHEGEYICITDGCNASMVFNPMHEQRRHEKIIEVSAYFRLNKNQKHAYGVCPYDTKGAVEIIANNSDSDVLKSLDNHKYEFSLQVLHKPNSTATKNIVTADEVSADINNLRKGKIYKKEGVASSYIKALTQILTLRAQLEDNEELASLITLNYRGKKIKWNNFYFEVDDYINAYKVAHVAKDMHPVCFHGVVSKIIFATEKFKYNKIKVYSPYPGKLVDEITDVPTLEFLISDNFLDLEQFNVGDEILAYGKVVTKEGAEWVPPKQDDPTNPKKIRFLSMTIWINHAEQIVLI